MGPSDEWKQYLGVLDWLQRMIVEADHGGREAEAIEIARAKLILRRAMEPRMNGGRPIKNDDGEVVSHVYDLALVQPLRKEPWPKVIEYAGKEFIEVSDGREYDLPQKAEHVLLTLHHLSTKIWADRSFLRRSIERICIARDWWYD
jgi:hypothetical protein